MKTAVRDTSIAAYRGLPLEYFKTQDDRICHLVSMHSRHYGGNMSMQEIKALYKSKFEDIDLSTVSRSVNGLVAANRLERLGTTRKCSMSKISIHPVRVPLKQIELFQ